MISCRPNLCLLGYDIKAVGALAISSEQTVLTFCFSRLCYTMLAVITKKAAALGALSLSRRAFSSAFPSERLISASAAKSLLGSDKIKFVDVRAPELYSKGHIPDAVNINEIFTYLATSDPQGTLALKTTFETLFQDAGINGNEHVITYEDCLNTMYGGSCRGFYLLKLLGHPSVSVLHGGMQSWLKHGYPTSTVTPSITKGTFKASWSSEMWRSKDDVMKVLKQKNAILLDTRDVDEWKAGSSSPYGIDFAPRKGRIPGAIHMLWHDFMEAKEDRQVYFRKPQDVRERCAAKGLTPDKNIIIYCFKGSRSSNTYIALKEAGFNNISNYFGSWNEWSRDHSLEIDSSRLD